MDASEVHCFVTITYTRGAIAEIHNCDCVFPLHLRGQGGSYCLRNLSAYYVGQVDNIMMLHYGDIQISLSL